MGLDGLSAQAETRAQNSGLWREDGLINTTSRVMIL